MKKTKQRSIIKLKHHIAIIPGGVIFSLLFILGLFLFATAVKAEEKMNQWIILAEDIDPSLPREALATSIDINNLKIISQKENHLKISFDITNGMPLVQPNMQYRVGLTRGDHTYGFLEDELGVQVYQKDELGAKAYPEEIVLASNETISRTIEYTAPAYLSGEYFLWVKIQNAGGMFMEMKIIQQPVILNGDNQFVEIDPNSCRLFVSKEGQTTFSIEYTAASGMIIDAQKEKLSGFCEVVNYTERQLTLSPFFEVYRQSIFSNEVKKHQSKIDEFQLGPNEQKTVLFTLPVDLSPQAYDVRVTLQDQGKLVSDSAIFHYVVQGDSATIQNISLDKASYTKGGTAQVNLAWTGSADSALDSDSDDAVQNLTANITIQNGSGRLCGQKTVKLNQEKPLIKIDIPISATCQHLVIFSDIKNEEGKILAQRKSQLSKETSQSFLQNRRLISILILASLFVVILVFTFFLNTRKKQ